nr:nonstructural protein [Pangolin phlebovirus]
MLPLPVVHWRCQVLKKRSQKMGNNYVRAHPDTALLQCDQQHLFVYNTCPHARFPIKMRSITTMGNETTVYHFLDMGLIPARICYWPGSDSCVNPKESSLDEGLCWEFDKWSIKNLIDNGEIEVLRALSWPTGRPTLQFIREFCRSRCFQPYGGFRTAKKVASLIFKAAHSMEGDDLGGAIIKCWRKNRKEAERLGIVKEDIPGVDLIRDISMIQVERALMRVARTSEKWRNAPTSGWEGPRALSYMNIIPLCNLSQRLLCKADIRIELDPKSRVWMKKLQVPKKHKEVQEEIDDPNLGIMDIWLLDLRSHFSMFPDLADKILDKQYEKDWPALGAP